ncbi:protein phosphatase 2C domain-containing protein [Kitasatospora sp. RB6PN24]|uniref:protein phosphatase 2C domain-containing protein n=1 Tax=Kitasatospora humi TaxID=2893891 RepID=UPI001E4F39EE|nr:protein phosphatase 2C domain-containing protein [Kitasatospora humi]MCC9310937.1 protein phosphatase 2C domain-containing protein [Kitasatospora humi]
MREHSFFPPVSRAGSSRPAAQPDSVYDQEADEQPAPQPVVVQPLPPPQPTGPASPLPLAVPPPSPQALPVPSAAMRFEERWSPLVIDRPAASFEPRPPSGPSYRPDTLFDGWSTDRLTVRLASVRGYGHRHSGRPREDDIAVAVHPSSGTLVFAVADGVSSAEQPHLGATLACRTAVDTVLAQLAERRPELDWTAVAKHAAWQLVEHAMRVRQSDQPDAAEAERMLATTLVAGTVEPVDRDARVTVIQVGDSAAWVLRDGQYIAPLRSQSAPRPEVASSSVSPLPRLPNEVKPHGFYLAPDDVLLVGTDGFGDPLGSGDGPVGRTFARHLATPPEPRGLAHLLDFSRETFDDDRTLLAVWHRRRLDGGAR